MKKIGLHFGLNKVDPDEYQGWPGYLAGCWHDADSMAATFATLDYDAQGFFDEDCTGERLRSFMADAAASLVDGDTLVFSYSGHGGQSLGMMLGTTETMCLFDGQLSDTELRAMLSQFKAGVNCAVVADSCHAGGLSRAVPTVRARVAPLWVTKNLPVVQAKGDAPIAANALLLAACQRDELAGDGDLNGAFTGSLLAARGEGATWRQWYGATSRFMSKAFPDQHPALAVLNGKMDEAVV